MNLPKGIGQREVLIAVGILVGICIIAIPLVGYSQKKNRRAECEQLVASIRDAQLAHYKAFPGEGYITAKWAPRDPSALSSEAIEWRPSSGFTKLGWSPAQDDYEWVRGTYRVATDKDGFTVFGWCDIDNDGVPSKFEAKADGEVVQLTASDIY